MRVRVRMRVRIGVGSSSLKGKGEERRQWAGWWVSRWVGGRAGVGGWVGDRGHWRADGGWWACAPPPPPRVGCDAWLYGCWGRGRGVQRPVVRCGETGEKSWEG